MPRYICLLLFLIPVWGTAQELYVFSEPASNMPARSVAVKQSLKTVFSTNIRDPLFRLSTEAMFGINKNLMMHGAFTLSDMYGNQGMRFESGRIYAKYRFLSQDAFKRHFRMAAFLQASASRNAFVYRELSLEGDQGGVQLGIIATQLLHKFAVSATLSNIQVLHGSRWQKRLPKPSGYQALSYSLSAGYLIWPKTYTSYRQTNLNLYLELIGQQLTDQKGYLLDLAPAAQLIFNSSIKLNMGYRWQLSGNIPRMGRDGFYIGGEFLFLNALGKGKP